MEDVKILKEEIADLLATDQPDKCAPLLELAAQEDDLESVLTLRQALLDGTYGLDVDPGKAYQYTKKAARLGDAKSMYHTAVMELSRGSEEEAFEWMSRAWISDYPAAALGLAEMYADGTGTACDLTKAEMLASQALENGFDHDKARLVYGIIQEKLAREFIRADDIQSAANHLTKGMAQESSRCWLLYANELFHGRHFKKDLKQSFQFMEHAADLGSSAAMFNMAIACYNGYGTKKDRKAAFRWLKNAAKAGYAPAYYPLAYNYYVGDGVNANLSEACRWAMEAIDSHTSVSEASQLLKAARLQFQSAWTPSKK